MLLLRKLLETIEQYGFPDLAKPDRHDALSGPAANCPLERDAKLLYQGVSSNESGGCRACAGAVGVLSRVHPCPSLLNLSELIPTYCVLGGRKTPQLTELISTYCVLGGRKTPRLTELIPTYCVLGGRKTPQLTELIPTYCVLGGRKTLRLASLSRLIACSEPRNFRG